MPNCWAFANSGLSTKACIPKMMASKSVVIFSGNHPSSDGKIPTAAKRLFDGSLISSSEPVT